MDKRNRLDSPEINLYVYGQLVFDKGAVTLQRGKDSLFNKWYWDIHVQIDER